MGIPMALYVISYIKCSGRRLSIADDKKRFPADEVSEKLSPLYGHSSVLRDGEREMLKT